jgi:cellobiose phosphorylase
MAVLGEVDALWRALLVANPIAVTQHLAHASPRQRNAYFSSSDAAFPDRYRASAEWPRVRDGSVAVDGGWRIYSSGPGLYARALLQHVFGMGRHFGARRAAPSLPRSLGPLALEMIVDGRRQRFEVRSD